jgi:hypothetical protein
MADKEYEVVSASDIQFVRRGRKASVNPELVGALGKLGKGQALVLKSLAQNPKSDTYATDKSRISSQIRTACKSAGIADFRILWTPTGVPQVVR